MYKKEIGKLIFGTNFYQTTALRTSVQHPWFHVCSLYGGHCFKFFVFSCTVGLVVWALGPFRQTFQSWFEVIGFHPTCICSFCASLYRIVLSAILHQLEIFLSGRFLYFMLYNVTCAVSNFLFIIILNKHRVVTRYVFYISVCMICAYVESDIVAVFYFILNSQGSLNNLKLTALRTVALGLTLTLSFSSSMHIIRKVMKPQESLFEGLGERWIVTFTIFL